MTPTPPATPKAKSKAQTHVAKHATKYTIAVVMAGLIQVLNMAGVLAPILCSFSPDPVKCNAAGQAAKDSAKALEGIKLDDGTTLQLVPATNEGWDL